MRLFRILIAALVVAMPVLGGPTAGWRMMANGSVAPPTHSNLAILGNANPKPVWFSNDEYDDTYSGDFVFALQSLGLINLIGYDQTSSSNVDGYNGSLTTAYYNQEITDQANGFTALANSGWNTSTAPAISGTYEGHLVVQPAISSATAPGHPSTTAFKAAVNANATAHQPVIFACGGPLTLLADAYLSIADVGSDRANFADKVVVMLVSGDPAENVYGWYNEWADSMAARVVFKYFKVVCFHTSWTVVGSGTRTSGSKNISMPATRIFPGMRVSGSGIPALAYVESTNGTTTAVLNVNATTTATGTATFSLANNYVAVPKDWISARLPDSPIRSIMSNKIRTGNALPDGLDGDAQPLIGLIAPAYITGTPTRYTVVSDAVLNVSQGGSHAARDIPDVSTDSNGNLYFVEMDGEVATNAWWNVMMNGGLWTGGNTLTFTTVPGVDTFTRGNGGLGAAYGQLGAIARGAIATNQLGMATSGYAYDYSTGTYTNDHYASMKFVGTPAAAWFPSVGIRNAFHSGSNVNGYQIFPNSTTGTILQRGISGVYSNLLSGMPAMVSNDQWRVAVKGNLFSVWRNNGAESVGIVRSGWKLMGAVKDTSYSSGVPSILNSRSGGPTTFGDDVDFGNVTSP